MGFFSCFLGLNPHNFAKDYANVKNKYIYTCFMQNFMEQNKKKNLFSKL